MIKELYPRVKCVNGVSLSVQANQYAYCDPRIDGLNHWKDYYNVEVGFIEDSEGKPTTPPDEWSIYADGKFPSNVYGYVPIRLVKDYIKINGGEAQI